MYKVVYQYTNGWGCLFEECYKFETYKEQQEHFKKVYQPSLNKQNATTTLYHLSVLKIAYVYPSGKKYIVNNVKSLLKEGK